jgi:hypothetical protein
MPGELGFMAKTRVAAQVIDARLLGELSKAARQFQRAKGNQRIRALTRYSKILQRFNERALQGFLVEPGWWR